MVSSLLVLAIPAGGYVFTRLTALSPSRPDSTRSPDGEDFESLQLAYRSFRADVKRAPSLGDTDLKRGKAISERAIDLLQRIGDTDGDTNEAAENAAGAAVCYTTAALAEDWIAFRPRTSKSVRADEAKALRLEYAKKAIEFVKRYKDVEALIEEKAKDAGRDATFLKESRDAISQCNVYALAIVARQGDEASFRKALAALKKSLAENKTAWYDEVIGDPPENELILSRYLLELAAEKK
jgi:hypothetical protein